MYWEMIVGLETHIQLNTQSKLFSNSATKSGQHQNTQASYFDLGLPGTLPIINKETIRKAIIFGLAINGNISKNSFFTRKNYFYPDLPKGYQINQSINPIVQEGKLKIQTSNGLKTIRIKQAHLEEDAGKSVHGYIFNKTAIDYNRAGIPLLEIVTYPDFRSIEEVITYVKKLHQLVKYLNICDGNMQDGSFRCDINLSVKSNNKLELGTPTELKNINSFKFINKAIQYEYSRQTKILKSGGSIIKETRLYDSNSNKTYSMRIKENIIDYRCFPDPDLLPISITNEYIKSIKKEMPIKLEKRIKIYSKYLSKQEIEFLLSNLDIANYYDIIAIQIGYKLAYHWIAVELISCLNITKKNFSIDIIPYNILIEIINNVKKQIISQNNAKKIIIEYIKSKESIKNIIKKLDLKQISDDNIIRTLVQKIIRDNPKQKNDFKSGKVKIVSFFIGKTIKESKSKANPKKVNKIVQEELNKIKE